MKSGKIMITIGVIIILVSVVVFLHEFDTTINLNFFAANVPSRTNFPLMYGSIFTAIIGLAVLILGIMDARKSPTK